MTDPTPTTQNEPLAAKTCCECGEELPADRRFFRPSPSAKDGFVRRCTKCADLTKDFAARVRRHVEAVATDAAAASQRAFDRLDALLGELTGEDVPSLDLSTAPGRRGALGLRIRMAPPGGGAETAASARTLIAVADEDESSLRASRINLDALAAALSQTEGGEVER